jgi:RNA polymerase sigma-70 factor (ECF subfamily)
MDVATEAIDFAEFFHRCRGDCQRAVYAAVGDQRQAEELVAEAFARAWASWEKVGRHRAPQAWIVRTCLNAHVSAWWRHRREVLGPALVDPVALPAVRTEIDQQVVRALRGLPIRQREVVVLRTFLDLDTQATAQALGIAPGTVRSHLHRALTTLREQLASYTEQEVIR